WPTSIGPMGPTASVPTASTVPAASLPNRMGSFGEPNCPASFLMSAGLTPAACTWIVTSPGPGSGTCTSTSSSSSGVPKEFATIARLFVMGCLSVQHLAEAEGVVDHTVLAERFDTHIPEVLVEPDRRHLQRTRLQHEGCHPPSPRDALKLDHDPLGQPRAAKLARNEHLLHLELRAEGPQGGCACCDPVDESE